MDKETLSNYGWVVICLIVLVIMIALATPFGEFIREAVKSASESFGGLAGDSLKEVDSSYVEVTWPTEATEG